jgi:hypothetical protein
MGLRGKKLGCRRCSADLEKCFTRHGGEQIAENLLVLSKPLGILRVGLHGDGLGFLDFDLLQRRKNRAIKEPLQLGASNGREHLHLPELKIILRQLDTM